MWKMQERDKKMGKKTIEKNAITEGVIWKQLLIFFFPIMLGNVDPAIMSLRPLSASAAASS